MKKMHVFLERLNNFRCLHFIHCIKFHADSLEIALLVKYSLWRFKEEINLCVYLSDLIGMTSAPCEAVLCTPHMTYLPSVARNDRQHTFRICNLRPS